MNSEWQSIATNDGDMGVYFCGSGQKNAPALILIQEIFGVNDHIRSVCQRYADQGYDVYAPDLFWREQPRISLGYGETDYPKAIELYKATPPEQALADVLALRSHIADQRGKDAKCGVIGFCFGGLLTYLAAANAKFDAAVSYYGGGIGNRLDQASKITTPIVFQFGEKDGHIDLAVPEALKKAFAGRDDVEVVVHPGADHGFNCDARSSFHPQASVRASEISATFLAKYLKQD